jgi:murein DD-endopeptidase MepM/ murein hydrolase activator NlpD
MLSTDSSSPDGKRPGHRSRAQVLALILPLLLINIGVGQSLYTQLVTTTSASATQVKDDTTTLSQVDEAATDQSAEQEITTQEAPDVAITTYVVKSGDTLSGIAAKFGISVNTIRWANDLTEKTSKIAIGDELVILPVSGIEYTVKKGDTLSGIASKYDVDQEDILKYNDIEKNAIKVGMDLIIPGAEPIKAATPKPVAKSSTPKTPTTTTQASDDRQDQKDSSSDSYTSPVSGILTQGIHDGNAVDFGVPVGTSVRAFKSGTVIIAKAGGYNGGYGSYIVINHEGSCQTQYSHLSKVSVAVGDNVSQGETIGLSGNTGRSTGPHLHFNVRNCGGNPFTKYKIGTRF